MKENTGYSLLRDPRKNKGTAFTLVERKKYGLEGLLPARVETLETQMLRVNEQLDLIDLPIHKYSYLSNLLETNETLFFNLIINDPAKFLPLVYTPTVRVAEQIFTSGLAGVEKPKDMRKFIKSKMYIPEYK